MNWPACSSRRIPLLLRRGGCAVNKQGREATPSAPSKVASRHFLDVASTPPHEEGNAPNRHIVNSFTRLPARHKLPARRAGIGTLARGLVGIERHSCRIG